MMIYCVVDSAIEEKSQTFENCIQLQLIGVQQIKLMISLKIEHKHHLPCHPTRAYLQKQASIHQTDRQDISEQSEQDNPQFKTIQSRAINPNINPIIFDGIELSDEISNSNQVSRKKKKLKQNHKTLNSIEEIYHADVLDQQFVNSGSNLPKNIRALIMQKQKLVEDKVYVGTVKAEQGAANDILEMLYDEDTNPNNVKIHIKQNLLELMGSIQKNISNDINADKYYIHKIVRSTKNDILTNRKGRLNLNYSNQTNSSFPYNTSRSENDNMTTNSQPVSANYSLNSDETKRAENFIKKIQKEQIEQRQRRKQIEEKKKNIEIRSAEQKTQFEEEIKEQRRNYLRRRFEAKKEMRQKQMEVRQKMNKDYKQFLAKYKKKTPLFKKKQEEFEKIQSMEEEKVKALLLEKKKDDMKPIRYQDLKEHEKRYSSLKIEKETLKESEKKLRLEEINNKPRPNYHKSKYLEILKDQEEKEKEKAIKNDPKLLISELIKKRDDYSKSVRENHLPKGSPVKQKQLQQAIQEMRWAQQSQRRKLSDRQYIQQGDKNLQDLHKLMADLREKGKLPLTSNLPELTPPSKPSYKNYLEEMRHHEMSRIKRRSLSIDYDRKESLDLSQLKNMADKYQIQANRRYVYASSNRQVGKNLQQMGKADDEYLQSVKAKVALLNKLQ